MKRPLRVNAKARVLNSKQISENSETRKQQSLIKTPKRAPVEPSREGKLHQRIANVYYVEKTITMTTVMRGRGGLDVRHLNAHIGAVPDVYLTILITPDYYCNYYTQ